MKPCDVTLFVLGLGLGIAGVLVAPGTAPMSAGRIVSCVLIFVGATTLVAGLFWPLFRSLRSSRSHHGRI